MCRKRIVKVLYVFLTVVCVFTLSAASFNIIFPLKFRESIITFSNENNVDPVLLASIIKVESNFNSDAVSLKGAVGLMQIMPSTAMAFSKETCDEKELKKPSFNIKIGATFLKYLIDKYNDETTVLACYNAGEGVVLKWMKDDGKLDIAKIEYKETYNYVKRVQRLKRIYSLRLKSKWI